MKIKMLSYASSGFVVCIGVDIAVGEKPSEMLIGRLLAGSERSGNDRERISQARGAIYYRVAPK